MDSNKGFKSEFLVVRAQPKAVRGGRIKLACPTSWSRAHDEHGYKNFNLKPERQEGEEKETFRLLEAWGERRKRGLLKFYCGDIIQKGAESVEALTTLLNTWQAYDPDKDPSVAEREAAAEELAKKKATQRRKRERSEGSQTPIAEPGMRPTAEDLVLKEQLGLYILTAEDLAAVQRVSHCVEHLAELTRGESGRNSLLEVLKENEEL